MVTRASIHACFAAPRLSEVRRGAHTTAFNETKRGTIPKQGRRLGVTLAHLIIQPGAINSNPETNYTQRTPTMHNQELQVISRG